MSGWIQAAMQQNTIVLVKFDSLLSVVNLQFLDFEKKKVQIFSSAK